MLEQYKTKDCDTIFCYFMDAFSISLTKGKGTTEFKKFKELAISLEDDPNNNIQKFLIKTMQYVDSAQPKIIFDLLIEQDYLLCLRNAADNQMYLISLLKNLTTCLVNDDIETFFDTSNMWSSSIVAYAYSSFYPQIADIAQKYHMI